MPTFTPPTRGFYTPSVTPLTPEWQRSPARYFSKTNIPKPVNVFVLTDGTFTEQQPSSWDQVASVYYGGHVYTLTDDEAAALVDAGYEPYIVPGTLFPDHVLYPGSVVYPGA